MRWVEKVANVGHCSRTEAIEGFFTLNFCFRLFFDMFSFPITAAILIGNFWSLQIKEINKGEPHKTIPRALPFDTEIAY